jgi:hypothetical protein
MKRREFVKNVMDRRGGRDRHNTPRSKVIGANDRVIVGLIGCSGAAATCLN